MATRRRPKGGVLSPSLCPLPPPSRCVFLLVVGVPKHKKHTKKNNNNKHEKAKHAHNRNTRKHTKNNTRQLPVCQREKKACLRGGFLFFFFKVDKKKGTLRVDFFLHQRSHQEGHLTVRFFFLGRRSLGRTRTGPSSLSR